MPPLLEGPAGDQGHDEVRDAVLLAIVPDRQDVGMVERGGAVRLALEAPQEVRIGGEHGGQDLDRRLAPGEVPVPGAPDLAHAAAPDEADQFVGTDDPSCQIRHGRLP